MLHIDSFLLQELKVFKNYCDDSYSNNFSLFDLLLIRPESEDKTILTLNVQKKESYTYMQLTEMVNKNCAVWKSDENKVTAGSTVAILNQFGINQIINVLTALKLGCIFSVIDTISPLIMEKRLEIINPDFIIVDQNFEECFRSSGFVTLKNANKYQNINTKDIEIANWTYKPDDIISLCFDDKGKNIYKIIKISAFFFLRNLRRNAEKMQLLCDADFLLFPCCLYGDCQLGLILTALLEGVHFINIFIHEDFTIFLKNFLRLEKKKRIVLSVNEDVRDMFLEKLLQSREDSSNYEIKNDLKKVGIFFQNNLIFWFTVFTFQSDTEKWQKFITGYELGKTKSSILYWESPLFCFIFKSVDPVGARDRLIELDENNQYEIIGQFSGLKVPNEHGTGYYSEKINSESRFISNYVLSKHDSCYFLYVEEFMTKSGIRYPSDDLCILLNNKFGDAVKFCFVPGYRLEKENKQIIVLLIFNLNASSSSLSVYSTFIKQVAGDVFVPDKIVEYYYIPGSLNTAAGTWIREEYYSGQLDAKTNDRFFLAISYFRILLQKLNKEERNRGISCSAYCPAEKGEAHGII
jgi:hypothetical protein